MPGTTPPTPAQVAAAVAAYNAAMTSGADQTQAMENALNSYLSIL